MRVIPARVDVGILGAGPAGTAAAISLARAGRSVLLVDRSAFPRPKVCGDALTPPAVRALQQLEVEPHVRTRGHSVLGSIRHRSAGKDGVMSYDPLGIVVARETFDALLLDAAQQRGCVTLLGRRVELLWPEQEHGLLRWTEDGNLREVEVSCALLACGLPPALGGIADRKARGIMCYGMRGYASGHSLDASWLHFYPVGHSPGYVWIFPMTANRANVGAWLTAETWRRLGGRGEPVWAAMWDLVPEAGAAITGGPESIPFQTYPTVTLPPAQLPAGARWMCIGGAAGLVHAATGEGISYALWSGIEAAEWIIKGRLPGTDAAAAMQMKCVKEIGIYHAD